jgi:predicted O-methyltransferase YrrM
VAGEIKELFDRWYEQSGQIAPVRIPKLNRRRLAQLFGEYGLLRGAEIGVDRGKFSEYMLQHNPEMHLLLVDPWRWKLRGESRYQSTARRMEAFGDRATIIRADSFDAVRDIENESLDFVYIDGNHEFDYVMTDLIWWVQKVRYGGVVAGHDYYRFRGGGVVPAVDVYTQQHGITRWFLTDEKEATFFWIREPDPFEFEWI